MVIHFIRPYWWLAIIPVLLVTWMLLRQKPGFFAWREVCDKQLLPFLIHKNPKSRQVAPILVLFTSLFFMIVSLTGPSWSYTPMTLYKQAQALVIVLDMAENMLVKDIRPDRLSRAKFKIHDLLTSKNTQFGLVVYTGEPFVASPLTEDGNTIDALLPDIVPGIMPVHGNRLDLALKAAAELVKNAGFNQANILVFTASVPATAAINEAHRLSTQGIYSSILSLQPKVASQTAFTKFATAGRGKVLDLTDTQHKLHQKLTVTSSNSTLVLWKDEGRWFLIPAAGLFLCVFRRGWLERLSL